MSVRAVSYDAPGATIPLTVAVTSVPTGTTVRFRVPGGYCNPQPDGAWSHGSLRAQVCYIRLPSRAWTGRITAFAVLTRTADGQVSEVRGSTPKKVYTAGPASGALPWRQVDLIEHCGNTSRSVWLTFDDYLPSSTTTRQIIATLARNHVRGRFYLNRVSTADRAALIAAGHVVQSHTRDHVALNRLTSTQITAQLRNGPRPSAKPAQVRPPYGAGSFSTYVTASVGSTGYQVCRWTSDTSDWAGASATLMRSRVQYGDATTRPATAGGVVLMHAPHFNAARLQAVIDGIRARGLQPEPGR